MMNGRDIGTFEMRAKTEVQTQRCVGVRGEGDRDASDLSKGTGGHFEVRDGHSEIKNIRAIVTETIQETSIRRFILKVVHGFIESNMLSSLDSFGHRVEVDNILHSAGEAKENTNSSIRDNFGRTARMSRKSIDTAAEHTKEAKIRLLTSAHLIGRSGAITMNGNIVKAKEVMESIRPELGRESSTTKHGMECIANSLMRTLTRTILM
jgi:hypothetical protein